MIICNENCIHQSDGYCHLNHAAPVTGCKNGNRCVHFVMTDQSLNTLKTDVKDEEKTKDLISNHIT